VQVGDDPIAMAVYQAPDKFNRGGDANLVERTITFKATYDHGGQDQQEMTQDFRLVRPPLMLIHGVWSSSATWIGNPLITDPRWSRRGPTR
jgi:hypothetical protein